MMDLDEALKYVQNAMERAFEDWLESERPSGDCESVHRQWDESFAHQELADELQPVLALTWEVRRLREELAEWKGAAGVAGFTVGVLKEENERLKSNPPQSLSSWQPIATAPRDGSEFIAIDKLAVCPTPFVVCWTDAFQCFVVGGDSVMSLVLNDALHMDDTCSIDATHWMPLPDPAP